jgi:NAD(P)-dependent dehydrogenase (short-subunit alcohol dehydrogenase family)
MERLALHGRVSMITGGGSGIGRAIAHGLAEAGSAIALVDFDKSAADHIAGEIRERTPSAQTLVVSADVTKREELDSAVAKIVAEFGDLTIGVNNAGVGQWVTALEMSEAELKRMFDINVNGVFYGAVAQARHMKEAGYGKIINTASISGHIVNRPQPQSHYNAAKAAVIGFTRSLAVEWVNLGIRVNSISPTYTRTSLVDNLLKSGPAAEYLPHWLAATPMNALAEPTDLQGAAVFLASASSDFITGTDLPVDGGYLSV